MTEGMFKKNLSEKIGCNVDELEKKGYKALSAGILNLEGAPASMESAAACASKGIDIKQHRSRPLSVELISESDIIYGLSREHCSRIAGISPESAEKCRLLAEGKNIPDPIGQSQQVYNECADLIEEAVKLRVSEIVK